MAVTNVWHRSALIGTGKFCENRRLVVNAKPAAAKRRIPDKTNGVLLRFGRSSELVGGITAVFGANKRQDLPKIVGILDKGTEWRHRPDDIFTAYTAIAVLLKV